MVRHLYSTRLTLSVGGCSDTFLVTYKEPLRYGFCCIWLQLLVAEKKGLEWYYELIDAGEIRVVFELH